MKYAYAAFDLDGTLLNDQKTISTKNLFALEELKQSGAKILIATGRGKSKTSSLISGIQGDLTLICNNGAQIFRDGICWKNHVLSETVLEEVCQIGGTFGLHPYAFVDDERFSIVIPKTEEKERHLGSVCSLKEIGFFDERRENTVLSCVYIAKPALIEDLLQQLQHLKADVSMHRLVCFDKGFQMLEILHPHADKLTAIREVTQEESFMAFGDDNNDMGMIRSANYGIAMKNATEELKKVADSVSEYDNNHHGVYYEIMKVLGVL